MTGVQTCALPILFSISAQRFIQTLFKDAQLHHRLLQLMVRRIRTNNIRLQLRRKPPAIKLAYTLASLAQQYGQQVDDGYEMANLPPEDLADISEINNADDVKKLMEKLTEKKWLEVDGTGRVLDRKSVV